MKKRTYKATGSNKTSPLSKEQVEFILSEFLDKKDNRMVIVVSLLFRCIRIGDVTRTIKIQDIYEKNGSIKPNLKYREEKTGKERLIDLSGDILLKALQEYYPQIKDKCRDSVLFYQDKRPAHPLRDSGVKYLLRKFNGRRGISQCSPHSFRKGGARTMYLNGARIENIRHVLNHSSNRTTEIYMGITPEDVSESMVCLAI